MDKRISFGLAKTSSLSMPARKLRAVPSCSQLSGEDTRLLERFTSEVFASALACTAVLSCFNAIKLDRDILIPVELRQYMPLSPITFSAVSGSEIAELLNDEARGALSAYQYYLEAGKRLLSGHLEAGRSAAALEFATLHAVMQPFNTASSFSVLIIKDLQHLYAGAAAGNWLAPLRTLTTDLERAMRGASPYFKQGKFEVPGIADQMHGALAVEL